MGRSCLNVRAITEHDGRALSRLDAGFPLGSVTDVAPLLKRDIGGVFGGTNLESYLPAIMQTPMAIVNNYDHGQLLRSANSERRQ